MLDGPPEALPNGRVLSGALDNRIGIYAGLEILRRVAADPPEWDVALVVTVQEENNHGGARVTAQRLAPDVAIVIEVTYAGDAPGYAPWGGDVKLGGGPTVFRGPVVSPIVGDALLAIAGQGRHHGGDRDRARRRTPMPTTCSAPATGSPPGSSAFRSATCTRPARSCSCPMSDDASRLIEAYAAIVLHDAGEASFVCAARDAAVQAATTYAHAWAVR